MKDASRPLDFLAEVLSEQVLVQLKGSRAYRGELLGYDLHLNIVLGKADELEGDVIVRTHDRIVVRGDNVIFISP